MKVTFVYSQVSSSWLSCQTITRNLLISYSHFLPTENTKKTQVINLNKNSTRFDIEKMAEAIYAFSPDLIIFLDHSPHPWPLLNVFDQLNRKDKTYVLPRLLFHVYGDFPLMSADWIKTEAILKRYSINWICASDNQTRLIQKFIKKNVNSISKIPFPVDQSKFFHDPNLRAKTRQKLGIKDHEVVFVYSGRISYQKRVQDLIRVFEQIVLRGKVTVRLLIIGPFDSLGNPYTGEYFQEGEFAQKFISYINSFSLEVKSQITYLGCAEEGVLNAVYNASDIFTSLSTHNDEDYGMSPAEALCTGLPAILTNWGGYASFKVDDNQVGLVPTKINFTKPLIDINFKKFNELADAFIETIENLREKRETLSKKNLEILSIKGVYPLLKILVKKEAKKFEGFSVAMDKFDNSFKLQEPFLESHPKYSQFYNEIYESYISQKL